MHVARWRIYASTNLDLIVYGNGTMLVRQPKQDRIWHFDSWKQTVTDGYIANNIHYAE